ncbi:MAG: cytochrome c family protein [Phyllobacteriaceae bacterium]|nr:cytochrome c family protein [Phyllobacteriaceae bacterium]
MLISTSAHAMDGDPVAGEEVFRTCSTCHNVEEERNKVGPHLINVIGRTPGTVEGFRYSRAMTEFGEGGAVWDEETIAQYLADPRGFVRGNRMAFVGLKSEEEIANVIAYLAQFSETAEEGEAAEGEAATE